MGSGKEYIIPLARYSLLMMKSNSAVPAVGVGALRTCHIPELKISSKKKPTRYWSSFILAVLRRVINYI